MLVLSINSGSTSLKCSLYDLSAEPAQDEVVEPSWQAEISWIRDGEGELKIELKNATTKHVSLHASSREKAIEQILARLWTDDHLVSTANKIVCVAHRVVHGGRKYSTSTKIDDKVIEDLRNLEELAPNHERENLNAMIVARQALPEALHVAVFDTAFHHNLPIKSAIYALPYDWYERDGIRRYGFHGISHQYLAKRAAKMLPGYEHLKLITCHLGGGCSLSASDGGQCLDTTMGFTPLEGLVMQTRCGSIDPGLVMHQLKYGGYTIDELNTVLTKESGLKGLSGLSGDMKEIELAMASGNKRAQLAFDVFVQSVSQYTAFLVPILGKLDALVFAGGIGENSSHVRRSVCSMLYHLGIIIDETKNSSGTDDREISSVSAKVKVLVIHTKEELSMARAACQVFLAVTKEAIKKV